MPEIKNNFLKGKMNKDLDDRLIPQGEYIDALNVQITKSDGSNVGVIHNIKGNERITSIGTDFNIDFNNDFQSSSGGIEYTIGSFFDEKNNRIFWFVTDNDSVNYVYMRDIQNNTSYTLVQGAFLNFNSQSKITGINILEDLLFWTDNRNQPRRINISRAIDDVNYYNNELKISVAKYAPFNPPFITNAENDSSITSERMKEEFIRFAYRYKFKDGEYSVLSPFSTITFRMESNVIDTTANYYESNSLIEVASSTEVPNMVNNVNKITMRIPLPTVLEFLPSEDLTLMNSTVINFNSTSNLFNESFGAKEDVEIEKIDILYKESDSTAIRIVDTIEVSEANNLGYEEYVYKSTNFKATLPEDQFTRAFDNVPLKALAQEVAGNRLIYGNITSKQVLPEIDFTVTYSEKSEDKKSTETTNIYRNQSLKQRRSYEVGLVLADPFGRLSPVILSPTSTIYVKPKNSTFDNSVFDGDSLKISINSINYNGSAFDAETNPTGWYSYRVVVKQKEQDYYNVYTPGIWNYGLPKSYFTIHGDNINKVPRDTANVDNQDKFAPAATRLYPKVLNIRLKNEDDYSYRNSISGLQDVKDLGNLEDHSLVQTAKLFESTKNHLIGKIDATLGTPYQFLKNEGDFAVFETEPFESALDIYYETPTSGKLSDIDLNQYILDDFSVDHDTNTKTATDFSEANFLGASPCALHPLDEDGNEIPGALISFEIVSQDVADRYDVRYNSDNAHWEVYLKTAFAATAPTSNYTITISASGLGVTLPNTSITIPEANAIPQISSQYSSMLFDVTTRTPSETPSADNLVFKLYASNGSQYASVNKTGLTFHITYIKDLDDESTTAEEDLLFYSDFIGIAQNTDLDENGDAIASDGVALLYYKAEFSPSLVNHGERFELRFEAREFSGPAVSSDEVIVFVQITDGGAVSNQYSLYYASPRAFANAYEACQEPIGSINWSAKTVYWNENTITDPFVVEEGAVVPGRMYNDINLSTPATAGWYKRTDTETNVVGYYQITGNEPSSFDGWYYNTPVYCGTLTEAQAISDTQYTPPSSTTTTETTDNPYDTVGPAPDNNIP